MSSRRLPRFGIWAPHSGDWVYGPGERREARFELSKQVVLHAEKLGFESVLFAQHTIGASGNHESEVLEAWTACAAAAAVTSKIEIIAAIKPLLYHPCVLAKMALGIEDISNGRFALNFINGWSKPELVNSGIGFLEHGVRHSYGGEWLRIVRDLMEGKTVNYQSESFNVTDYTLRPAGIHRKRPYIYMGGESEPSRDLAAELVDTHLTRGRPLEEAAELVRDIARRPRSSGRPLDFGIAGFVGARPTDKEAKEFVASLEARLGTVDLVEETRRRELIDPKAQHVAKRPKEGDARRLGAGGGTAAGFIGSYDYVAQRIVDFYDVGLTTFLHSFSPLFEEQERFIHEVVPRVHSILKKRSDISYRELEAASA
ncbi:alkanesulfonate monooxygenase [Verrucomicrobium sp. GAS474]|uniref:LLM class flavin-dependent oxidoreductase n=1 Tax=Verrucomicrobium sp. GAS474 TaxID=1882831 RepID=UPI00087D9F67|nr:LLM class flavin-dependent oxidoreductase [Verrucomicrobium sp. GAS474]SDT85747.1 alkanesulfonate monooxygenase [Verrucomicrobium sp. GAS474]